MKPRCGRVGVRPISRPGTGTPLSAHSLRGGSSAIPLFSAYSGQSSHFTQHSPAPAPIRGIPWRTTPGLCLLAVPRLGGEACARSRHDCWTPPGSTKLPSSAAGPAGGRRVGRGHRAGRTASSVPGGRGGRFDPRARPRHGRQDPWGEGRFRCRLGAGPAAASGQGTGRRQTVATGDTPQPTLSCRTAAGWAAFARGSASSSAPAHVP